MSDRPTTRSELFAYIFNTTALGLGVLFGLWALYRGDYLRAGIVFFVLVPLFFTLQDWVDAPRLHK